MSAAWLEILRRNVELRSQAVVARELGISAGGVSLVLSGKYPASTHKIEDRVMRIYGAGSHIDCPASGEITPSQCVELWDRARRIGVRAGNPATIRRYNTCRKCPMRND